MRVSRTKSSDFPHLFTNLYLRSYEWEKIKEAFNGQRYYRLRRNGTEYHLTPADTGSGTIVTEFDDGRGQLRQNVVDSAAEEKTHPSERFDAINCTFNIIAIGGKGHVVISPMWAQRVLIDITEVRGHMYPARRKPATLHSQRRTPKVEVDAVKAEVATVNAEAPPPVPPAAEETFEQKLERVIRWLAKHKRERGVEYAINEEGFVTAKIVVTREFKP